MFLCDKCAPKHGVSSVETLIYLRSFGECEECHRPESCMDVPFVAAQHLRALDFANGSRNSLALLEECLVNGNIGRDTLYAWFISEKKLINEIVKDAQQESQNQ